MTYDGEGEALISDSMAYNRHQPQLQDQEHGASVSHGVHVYSPAYTGTYLLLGDRGSVYTVPKVELDSAAAGTKPAISNRKSNDLTIMPVSYKSTR